MAHPVCIHFRSWLAGLVTVAACGALVGLVAGDEPRLAARRKVPPPEDVVRRTFKPVDEIQVEPRLDRPMLPDDTATGLFSEPTPVSRAGLRRDSWTMTEYNWSAPEFFHRPLYFEDAPLERYGHSAGYHWQPAVSGVRFFGKVVLFPYNILVNSPRQWVSPLGFDRPGSDADPIRERAVTLPGDHPRRAVVDRPQLP